MEVRVRFAPSPTGALHIGGVRTALYNYLFARQQGGKMLLRLEDTDQTRFVPGAEKYILDALRWAGIEFDEGAGTGGPYAPYKQSERKDLYFQFAEKLLQSGRAYYAFDAPEELEEQRKKSPSFLYGGAARQQLKNSLTLSSEEVTRRLSGSYVIRIKIPENETIAVNDMIRGEVRFHSSQLDDKVLMKSDGMPTYHLACVVDDYLMKISHVIRGEEWLPSSPLHVLLYRYLGWEENMPRFAHLPLLLKPDGKGKLSKRDAEAGGFPVFPLAWNDPKTGETAQGFREAGYLPEAMVNFLALLGWSPGNDNELLTMKELVSLFSVERIQKAGARFDIKKAVWFNQHYLRKKSDRELAEILLPQLKEKNIACEVSKAERIASALRERISFPNDLGEQSLPFFIAPQNFDEGVVSKKWNIDARQILTDFASSVKNIQPFQSSLIKEGLDKCSEKFGGSGKILQLLRVSLMGTGAGPDLMQFIEEIGADETARRIDRFVKKRES